MNRTRNNRHTVSRSLSRSAHRRAEEFTEDVSHSLQMALNSPISARCRLYPAAQHVAFLTNKIKGAELDGVKWLADVAGAMEQGMLIVASTRKLSLTKLMHIPGRRMPSKPSDSIQGNRAMADQDTRDELIDRINAYGTIEIWSPKRRSSRPLVRSVSKRRTAASSRSGIFSYR